MRPRNKQEGVILILTMFIIAALMILILEFSGTASVERSSARGFADEIAAMEAAKSAIFFGVQYLAEDARSDEARKEAGEGIYDALGEQWATPRHRTIGDADVTITIEDENRRLNIYPLAIGGRDGAQLERLLNALAERGVKVESGKLVENLIKYVNDVRRCPLRTKDELMLVDGFDSPLYYGVASAQEGGKPSGGLAELLGGEVRVNINTAPVEVLMAVSPAMTWQVAEAIVAARGNHTPFTSMAELSKRVASMGEETSGGKTLFDALSEQLTVASTHFTITGEARRGMVRCRVQALAERSGERVRILSIRADPDKHFFTREEVDEVMRNGEAFYNDVYPGRKQ